MLVAISGTIVAPCNRIRTYLYHTERGGRTGEGLPQAMVSTGRLRIRTRPDKGIYIICSLDLEIPANSTATFIAPFNVSNCVLDGNNVEISAGSILLESGKHTLSLPAE